MGSLYSDTDFQANMVTHVGTDPRLTVATMDEIDEQKHLAYELGKTTKNTTGRKFINIIDTQLIPRTNTPESTEGAHFGVPNGKRSNANNFNVGNNVRFYRGLIQRLAVQ